MPPFQVGIIGCGRPRSEPGATGFGQGHLHAAGYEASPECQIVAAADVSEANLEAFRQRHDVPRGYLDYRDMLAAEDLDILSVCTWPHLHAQMVIDAARAGVKAIHAEKPMAPTWGEARHMAQVCQDLGVQLTFNHQRRFGAPFRTAKQQLDDGAIGDLVRIEAFTSNLFDWGTHWFDMMFYYNDECPVEWVLGQIDARGGRQIFGVMVEGQGMSLFRWENGVLGMLLTGQDAWYEPDGVACANRLIGAQGTIEVGVRAGPQLRLRSAGTGGAWQAIDVSSGLHGGDHVVAGVLDLVDALVTGREPVLSARKALQATELIFATYESSRRRARVELPLEIDDSPLLTMLAAGDL
ncbi:MAG: Gfo/Idh/MocA family oxidoreductase [Anaerolineae bacterium]|nr:Gfo/Idh/MocA family oxidoreductase [Anaerolineae bacterium]